MANVTDSSSLLVVPSGWSDGVLGSLKPDDGSGDFTFSRGSDLSATRVNEDGYIEKGYENLVLYSNTFDGPAWSSSNLNITWDILPNQTGYDGSNNAWSIGKSVSANGYWRQTGLPTGVVTHSLYAKSGSLNGFLMFGGIPVVRVNLDTGDIYGFIRELIYLNVTPLDDGWKKIVFACVNSGLSIQPQDADNNLSAAGNILIQNYQINYGLVELPYIESGATRAKVGISEDQPRIDYKSGNGALLIEPSATNASSNSEYISGVNFNIGDFISSPEGILNGVGFRPTGTMTTHYISLAGGNLNVANSNIVFSFYVKEGTQPYLRGRFDENSFTKRCFFGIDLTDNSVLKNGTGASNVDITFEDSIDGWKKVIFTANYDSTPTGNGVAIFLGSGDAMGTDIDSYAADGTDFFYIYGIQIEQGDKPTSYIPTYGTSSTRAKDTATLTKNVAATGTIFININADSAKTLTFLGGNVSVTQGVNKIALAYSPTALKISHNGSIVQNIARSLDTSSLTEIQLGHRNNFEQTTDSINQFLTLDSFLTDTELNELTA